jgi:hypothetical protein
VHVFGFQEDVDWVEMLYTAAYASLVTYLHPKWDNAKGYDENVYNFKVAGHSWKEINAIAVYNGHASAEIIRTEEAWDFWTEKSITREVATGKMGGRLIAAYKRHAKAIGDTSPVATQSFEHFRRSYAEGFVDRLGTRLYWLYRKQQEEVETSGAELVLFDAMAAVKEAMWEQYPGLKPLTPEEREANRRRILEAEAERLRARNAMLDAMTEKQRTAFLEKEQRQADRERRASERYWNSEAQRNRTDYSALQRGGQAADNINISRSRPVKENSERKQIDG